MAEVLGRKRVGGSSFAVSREDAAAGAARRRRMRVMKNSEDAMEKVLAGLREVEAPDGMERRILAALEDRAKTKSESGLSWLRPMWLERQMIGRALVCGLLWREVVAVGLAISAFRRMERAPVPSKADSPSTGVRPSAESASPIATVAPSQGGVQAARKRGVTVVARTSNGEVEAATDDDSVAMSEMRAASHPAPPMPLTEQEVAAADCA